ncbi:MAG: CRTAC1 family protein [Candidatus Binatia bacterium]|nr:CRTAC1 family protein [Candidatus Binatia bacterium]
MVRGAAGANELYRKRGDGTFEAGGERAGVALSGARSVGPVFVDFDGDGWLDLFVPALLCPDKFAFCDDTPVRRTAAVKLFRNRGDGTFQDVTEASGLRFTRDSFSAAWGDYDLDGDLDLFVTHWGENRPPGSSEHLWRNNGDATFTDVSVLLGISAAFEFVSGDIGNLSFAGNFADIDSDGWPDLLVTGDFRLTKVFQNLAGQRFLETTTAVISDENGMGAAVGDYDNVGDLDWFVSSIWDPDQDNQGNNWYVSGNRLYRNRGDGSFDDATDLAGVRAGYWGWAATFADLDNDGWLDLYHVNGWRTDDPAAYEFHRDPAVLFHNRGDGAFEEIAEGVGAADRGQGCGLVAFDYDRDGDLGLFIANIQGPPALYRNELPAERSFLSVRLIGRAPNSEGIGARVWVEAAGSTKTRELRAGTNFVSQDPAEAHFGLGAATGVERLRVRWPSGEEQEWEGLPANAWVTVWQGEAALEIRQRTAGSSPIPTEPISLPTSTPLPTATLEGPSATETALRSPTVTQTAAPPSTGAACPGDCSGDAGVSIDELVLLVRIALSEADGTICAHLFATASANVTIDYSAGGECCAVRLRVGESASAMSPAATCSQLPT